MPDTGGWDPFGIFIQRLLERFGGGAAPAAGGGAAGTAGIGGGTGYVPEWWAYQIPGSMPGGGGYPAGYGQVPANVGASGATAPGLSFNQVGGPGVGQGGATAGDLWSAADLAAAGGTDVSPGGMTGLLFEFKDENGNPYHVYSAEYYASQPYNPPKPSLVSAQDRLTWQKMTGGGPSERAAGWLKEFQKSGLPQAGGGGGGPMTREGGTGGGGGQGSSLSWLTPSKPSDIPEQMRAMMSPSEYKQFAHNMVYRPPWMQNLMRIANVRGGAGGHSGGPGGGQGGASWGGGPVIWRP